MSGHASSDKDLSKREIKKIVNKLDSLPTVPTVAAKILKTLTEDDPDVEDIVKLIETDQATTMKILKLVNSAHFAVHSHITSIRKAVVMLGLSEVRCVLLSVTVSESFIKALRKNNAKEQEESWKHSLICAVCAEILTNKICPDLNGEVFVSALLHDVGKLILKECFPDNFNKLEFQHTEQEIPWLQAEQDIFGVDHTTVGKWLAEKWNLPELFVQAIWLHHHPLNTIQELDFIRQKKAILTIHLADILAHEIMSDSIIPHHTGVGYDDLLDFLKISPGDLEELMSSVGKYYSERASLLDLEEDESSFYYHALQRANQKLARLASQNGAPESLRKINRELVFLHDLNLELAGIEDPEKVLDTVAQTTAYKLKKREGMVYYLNRQEKKVIGSCWFPGQASQGFSVALDEKGRPIPHKIPELSDGLKRLIETSHTRFSKNTTKNQQINFDQHGNIYLVMALIIDGRIMGEIGIVQENDTATQPQPEDDFKTYRYLASITEAALSRLRLIEKERETTESLSTALAKNSQITVRLKKSIREKQVMEQEILRSQKLDSLAVLAGGIAHDFNNILAAISGNVSLAKRYLKPGEKAVEKLIQAEKAFLRARDLAGQLLTFSKKGGSPAKRPQSIAGLVRDSADFALRGSNVRCECSIIDDLWPVEVDEGQINQVINNLIINADQAMPGGGTIRVKVENMSVGSENSFPLRQGKYVKIDIRDQGIGIKEEDLPKIFDPYFTTKEEGNGLGLATAYSIIKKHDGYINVGSKTNVGTTFQIYLPVSEKATLIKKDEEKKTLSGNGKVLIMDDEKEIRDIAGEMLKSIGYEVGFAKDGIEALESYRMASESENPFDAVILDLTVPGGMGGKEAIQKLQEIDPDIKAIVSSGYINDPVMVDFRQHGFRDVIAKPYKLAELSVVLYETITNGIRAKAPT
ncbi:MAG: HDOD domain-containing protein [Thermodesulfobacteriota bacterium]|nr:HDOD domain-containing protein [Thermodesulfobacteriota bacterium]